MSARNLTVPSLLHTPAAALAGRAAALPAPSASGGGSSPSSIPVRRRAVDLRRIPSRRRGAVAVEAAVVTPLLMFFALAMIDYGRLVMVQQILTNASREGCRVAVVSGATTSQVTTQVNEYLAGANLAGATTELTPSSPGSAAEGTPITVTVSVPFSQVAWMPSLFLNTTTVTANATMRRDQSN